MLLQANAPSTDAPSATAGLSAPPETGPIANAPGASVKPNARPKNELFSVSFDVATLRTTNASANVNRNSTTSIVPDPATAIGLAGPQSRPRASRAAGGAARPPGTRYG